MTNQSFEDQVRKILAGLEVAHIDSQKLVDEIISAHLQVVKEAVSFERKGIRVNLLVQLGYNLKDAHQLTRELDEQQAEEEAESLLIKRSIFNK